nr:hypothetical protein A6C57_19105 [Fibrella sp. ES10-3-2-2]
MPAKAVDQQKRKVPGLQNLATFLFLLATIPNRGTFTRKVRPSEQPIMRKFVRYFRLFVYVP